MRVIGRVIEWEREREKVFKSKEKYIYICIYIIYIIEPKYNICISDSRVDKSRQSKKITKKSTNNTSKDTHSRAKSTKSINQILLFHHFRAIFYPQRCQQWPLRWSQWRRCLDPSTTIGAASSFFPLYHRPWHTWWNRHRWRRCGQKHRTNAEKQIIQIYGDDNNNVIDIIAFIERSKIT